MYTAIRLFVFLFAFTIHNDVKAQLTEGEFQMGLISYEYKHIENQDSIRHKNKKSLLENH